MSSLFGSPKTPEPIVVDTTAEKRKAALAAEMAAKGEADLLRKRKGYGATIVTGNMGLPNPAPVLKQSLGGA